jgi:hypothetical protein
VADNLKHLQINWSIIFVIDLPQLEVIQNSSAYRIDHAWLYVAVLSCGQSSWLQIQRTRVQFPALPDILRSSRSGTGSTQPREDNWGATWVKRQQLPSRKSRLTVVGTRCADHATPSIHKSWH